MMWYVVFERSVRARSARILNHFTRSTHTAKNTHSKKSTLEYTIDRDVNSNTNTRTPTQVQLFGYLSEKDLFGEEYQEQLSKRLLNGRSKSDHAERFMIGKLKLICGAQFTSKMEGMLNDLNVASDHNAKFHKYLSSVKKTLPVQKFQITILTTGFWPKHPDTTCTLPPVMADCVEKFSKWHSNTTSHRTLKFAYGLGKAVVRGQFGKWYVLICLFFCHATFNTTLI